MTAIELMELANDVGFTRRVQFTMFEVAKTKVAGSPTADELAYIHGIVNGEVPVLQMAIGVLLDGAVQTAGAGATDAEIEVAVTQVFGFYAGAWAARTV